MEYDTVRHEIQKNGRKSKMRLKRRDISLLEGPLLKNILLFSIPIILSSVLQLLFNAADVIVVGRFAGETELAAVGSTGSTINLIVNICIGFSIGANVLVARCIGAKDAKGTFRAVHTSVLLSIISGFFAGAILFVFAAPLLRLLDTPADIISSAIAYLRAYAIGVPATVVYNFGTAILRAKGDTTRPLYFLLIAGIVNVILNLILVIVFHLGAVGVGIATAVSQYVAAILVLFCLIHESSPVKLHLRKLHFYAEEIRSVLAIGLPAGVQSSLFSISNMLIQASVNSFNSTALVAGNAAASNIEGFEYVAMHAIYQTMLTMTGQCYGAKKFDRIDRGLKTCCGAVAVIGFVLGILIVLFDEQLLSIYTSDAEVIRYGCKRFLFLAFPYFLCGIMEVVMGAVRGLGYSILPMCVALLGACGFRVLWILTVFAKYHTYEVLYISYTISWIITTIAHFISFLYARKKVRHQYADASAS